MSEIGQKMSCLIQGYLYSAYSAYSKSDRKDIVKMSIIYRKNAKKYVNRLNINLLRKICHENSTNMVPPSTE